MLESARALDRILRGETTSPATVHPKRLDVPLGELLGLLLVLGAAYGVCMASFALTSHPSGGWKLLASSLVKVPALFLLTLVVTFPSLYVFNALVGSRLRLLPLLRLLIAALAVTLAVLASLGPIVAFFSLSTTDYGFVVLLNVATFGIAGLLGLKFLHQTLHRLSAATQTARVALVLEPGDDLGPVGDEDVGPLDAAAGEHVLGAHVTTVFRCWMVLFGLVGTQMGWVLRPFIGDPSLPFAWLRPTGSSFFEAVWHLIVGLVP